MEYLIIVGLVIIAVMGLGVVFGGAPFVPTRKKWIKEALKLSGANRNDVIVDLGSGDGAVLVMALEHGVKRAIGYEVNPMLAVWSRWRLRRFKSKVSILNRDFFRSDLPSDTTIIYMFQVDWVLRKIGKYIESQKPKLSSKTIKVVCFGFKIPGAKVVRKLNGMTLYEF
jgi:hypothetical protein